jgi:hypothetical protein
MTLIRHIVCATSRHVSSSPISRELFLSSSVILLLSFEIPFLVSPIYFRVTIYFALASILLLDSLLTCLITSLLLPSVLYTAFIHPFHPLPFIRCFSFLLLYITFTFTLSSFYFLFLPPVVIRASLRYDFSIFLLFLFIKFSPIFHS